MCYRPLPPQKIFPTTKISDAETSVVKSDHEEL